MKKNLFYTVLVGFLIITLPCFARDLTTIYQEAKRIQFLKGYAEEGLLLTPVSVDLVAHDAWSTSGWHMIFQQESFDMAQFASAFEPEVRDKILDLILDEIENRGFSDDLMGHPLVLPVWVSGNVGVNFNQWVQDRQTSGQEIIISVAEGDSFAFKPGNMYDSTPVLHCPDDRYSNTFLSAWSKQYDKAQFPPDSPLQFSVVKAGDDKLPPNPFPLPPFPPKLYVVKAGDDKLPPNPLPLPPFPPKLYVVKAGDDKLPPNPLPLPPFPPKLYFVVWPTVTPDQRGFSKELLDEFQFKKAEVITAVTANGIIDGYGEAGCEQGNIFEEVAFINR